MGLIISLFILLCIFICLCIFANQIRARFLPSKYGVRPYKKWDGTEAFRIYYKDFWPYWKLVYGEEVTFNFEAAMRKIQHLIDEDLREIENKKKRIAKVKPKSYK